jgi:hypothetical protein
MLDPLSGLRRYLGQMRGKRMEQHVFPRQSAWRLFVYPVSWCDRSTSEINVLSQQAQCAAAVRAGLLLRHNRFCLARQCGRQRSACGLARTLLL